MSNSRIIRTELWSFLLQAQLSGPTAMATSSSLALLSSFRGPELYRQRTSLVLSAPSNLSLIGSLTFTTRLNTTPRVVCSVSVSNPEVKTGRPDDLVASILSKVAGTDGGVSLSKEQHQEVADVAQELQKYCVPEPVKCPLIFGEWDVAYCSRPTSPGGGYRSALGRLFFRTKEMIQVVEAPDTVRNKVAFSAMGFLDGEVSLKGTSLVPLIRSNRGSKLKALDDSWIQVIFEAPQLKVGAMEFRYGGESEVKLQITYIDEKIRLGKGSRGSLFVFQRR